jgi:hypothetical protein
MARMMNWDRPRYRTAGKQTESVSGSDVPVEFRSAPPRAISKFKNRAMLERVTAEFLARGGSVKRHEGRVRDQRRGK